MLNTVTILETARAVAGFDTPSVPLNFQDTKTAFASKSTLELIRSRFVLNLCTWSFLVNNNDKLIKFGRAVLGGNIFDRLMKMTFYGQFVGGRDVPELRTKLDTMKSFGVKPILDYSVEADLDAATAPDASSAVGERLKDSVELACDATLEVFLQCLEAASAICTADDAFTAIKVTGLSRPDTLLQVSSLMKEAQELFEKYSVQRNLLPKFMELNALPKDVLGPIDLISGRRMTRATFDNMLMGIVDEVQRDSLFASFAVDELGEVTFDSFLDQCMPGRLLYDILTTATGGPREISLLSPVDARHQHALQMLEERLTILGERAHAKNAKLLIDAEQTYFQPLIDYFANRLMEKYNTDKVIAFNTYQCYLRGTPNQLIRDAGRAEALGYKMGAKLVRGAYMEQERQRATDMGYADPIWANKELTNSCYHNMVEIMLKQVDMKRAMMMVASHNEFSIQYVVERMKQSGIDPQRGGIFFGQLLGMCDQITYLLGSGGYCSYKYVPYGPVDAVLPYLSRRALENRGMLKDSKKELDLLKNEIRRRMWGLRSFFGR